MGSCDARKLFGRCADDETTISRAYLEQMAWLLRPFLTASPIHTLHVDTKLGHQHRAYGGAGALSFPFDLGNHDIN